MKRDHKLRTLIRSVAVRYDRGECSKWGTLPSPLMDKLSINKLEVFGHIIFEAEALAIEEGFQHTKEVDLPYLGRFSIKKGWPVYHRLRKEILEQNNLTESEFRSLPADERLRLMEDLETKAHAVFSQRLKDKHTLTPDKKAQILLSELTKFIK